jgi:hypothetical protein
LLSKNKFIPCCDDEPCESVETSTNRRAVNWLRQKHFVHAMWISWIFSAKSPAEQHGSVFHPQYPTEYPRHFQSFRTTVGLTSLFLDI